MQESFMELIPVRETVLPRQVFRNNRIPLKRFREE